jgi:hypothetical protein
MNIFIRIAKKFNRNNGDSQNVCGQTGMMSWGTMGADKLYEKPVDEGVVLGDRVNHEDGEAVGGGGGG